MNSTSMNDFFIEKILGRGSFGSVYLVRRKQDQKIYALKTVTFEKLSKRDQENSLNEVRILASINHPNVIGYKEAFWDDSGSSLNIVMEYADDGDLETKIIKMRKEGGMFNESLIWSYSIQMIEGLKALHDKKVMHRDIKSANIFLVKDNHQCKIGDMNVSKVIKEKVLRTQTGTPYYASPEVWRDEPYSYKSDLWSIGCVIYELCALRPPFKGNDLDELYGNVCRGNIERISHIYSDDLWKMILMLLQVDVKKRVDCKEFLDNKLIMKKIKEMKENNSEFKDLEKNKCSYSGILLKTIKFKDLKDIKSQLPKQKNYDINYDLNLNNFHQNSTKENTNNIYHYYSKNLIKSNIMNKKNYYSENLMEQLENNINHNNIINNSNNINNFYYINYSQNYNECFPNKMNNHNNGKRKIEYKFNENYIMKTDTNNKNDNILEKIDLNSLKNNKKRLIQKNEVLRNYNSYITKLDDDSGIKKFDDLIEKNLFPKDKEKYINKNKKMEKFSSKGNAPHYNKIKNIEKLKMFNKRPVSSSRIVTTIRNASKQKFNYNSNFRNKCIPYNNYEKKYNTNNCKDKLKKNLCIQIFETERKKRDISNIRERARTPLGSGNKTNTSKHIENFHIKYNNINNSKFSNKKNNINSYININCMTSPEDDEDEKYLKKSPTFGKINETKNKIKQEKELWERKNVKISKNTKIKKNIYSKEQQSKSITPNKRNPKLNPNLYDNNNCNHIQKKLSKNNNILVKDSFQYKFSENNEQKYIGESETNPQTRPMTCIGNEYQNMNKINSNYINKNYIKKDINNGKYMNNNTKRINVIRPNSCKNSIHDNNYIDRKNYRKYNPDITDPELLMMVNPIKIRENSKSIQKNCLNITVNNNVVNQNIFLQHMKPCSNMNTNGNIMDNNKERYIEHINENNKYNHMKIYNNLYLNNENNNDEPVKVINIFN